MAAKLNPNILYVREPRESLSSHDSDRLAQAEAGEESSDSDGEQEETSHKLIRKVSTSGQIRAKGGETERDRKGRVTDCKAVNCSECNAPKLTK
ncbi:hypothetical protein SKAU_G00227740 [Synaphobranchus kaupii]|uniref:Uncharacterized protein n=1 Tax=Synaphobranchus kaupii TaxID=118154 RepID=A0A9Q1F563_SYNKA|nr:hypothetical protein SKAU_G00227740 [Synaphobranchus kaupii]